MKRLFLLAGVLMLIGGLSTMNAEVIYVTENGVGDGMSWNSAAPLADALSWAAKEMRFMWQKVLIPVVLR